MFIPKGACISSVSLLYDDKNFNKSVEDFCKQSVDVWYSKEVGRYRYKAAMMKNENGTKIGVDENICKFQYDSEMNQF